VSVLVVESPEEDPVADPSELLLPVLARGICRRLSMLCKLASRLDVSSETEEVEAMLMLPAAMDELASWSSSSSILVMVVSRERSSKIDLSPISDVELSTSIPKTAEDREDDPAVKRGMLDEADAEAEAERHVCACC
jgi:hypothetical protein